MGPGQESHTPVQVLLVEDELGDALLIQEGFKRACITANVSHVGNGEDCLNFLAKTGAYADAPTVDMILLDLHIPVVSSHEVMKVLVADERFCHLPVVVFAARPHEEDINEMYTLRCNTFIVKPGSFEELQEMVETICDYWFGIATLPKVIR